MSREPDPATPSSRTTTTIDVVIGLFTAGVAAAFAIAIFTVRDAFGLRQPGSRVKRVR